MVVESPELFQNAALIAKLAAEVKAASVGGLFDSPLTAAHFALRRINLAAGLRLLFDRLHASATASRAFFFFHFRPFSLHCFRARQRWDLFSSSVSIIRASGIAN
jgi:hypothetical protein